MSSRIKLDEVRTIFLSSLGSALEYYDFTVFIFFTYILSDVFFAPSTPEWLRVLQTFAIFAIGYFIRPVGGLVIAHFGDKLGRKKMFLLTVMLMAVPTLLIGLLPTYAQIGWFAPALLLLMRVLQGCALGGELPGAITFVFEHANTKRVGFSCAALMGCLYLGLALGASMSGMLTALLPSKAAMYEYGWRIPFIVGGVFGLTSAYLRRYLHETPLFAELHAKRQLSRRIPLVEALSEHLPACLYVGGLAIFLNQITTILFQYLPTFLIGQYKISPDVVFWANTAAIVVYASANLIWGLIGDMIGRSRTLAVGGACTGLAVLWFYIHLSAVRTGDASLMQLWCAIGLGAGFVGLFASLSASLFPTAVRLTGFAFSYNVATALASGVVPVFVTWLTHRYGGEAPFYLALEACTGFVVLGLLYPRLRAYLGEGDAAHDRVIAPVPISTRT